MPFLKKLKSKVLFCKTEKNVTIINSNIYLTIDIDSFFVDY